MTDPTRVPVADGLGFARDCWWPQPGEQGRLGCVFCGDVLACSPEEVWCRCVRLPRAQLAEYGHLHEVRAPV